MFPPTDAWRRRRRRLAAGASAASGIEASVVAAWSATMAWAPAPVAPARRARARNEPVRVFTAGLQSRTTIDATVTESQ